MKHWAWLLSLPISLGLHALSLAAVVWLLAETDLPGILFVELNPPAAPAPAPKRPTKPEPSRIASKRVPSTARDTAAMSSVERAAAPAPAASAPLPASAPVQDTPHTVIAATAGRDRGEAGAQTEAYFAPRGESPSGPAVFAQSSTRAPGREGGIAALAPIDGNGTGGGGHANGTGSDGMTAALGVRGGGADYGSYQAAFRQWIQDVLRYPSAARRRGISGTVEIEILVQPNGAVSSVAVVDSSSHRVLDDAAVEAARSLPRVPFPEGFPPRALRLRVPVVFELR